VINERTIHWLDRSCAASYMDANVGYYEELGKLPYFPSLSFN